MGRCRSTIVKWQNGFCDQPVGPGSKQWYWRRSLEIPLDQVCEALGLSCSLPGEMPLVTGWSIDSRTVNRGDLFFAIKGDIHDGHAYLGAAFERGAIAAVVSDPVEAPGFLLRVPDTVGALQRLARWARRRWAKPVVAVTGSAGKTSTKDIAAELLAVKFRVGKTTGNLNNHLGLPLSLLRMPDDAELGVMEMGMNHAGEIRALADLARPDIGVVTNVSYAHIESFDSVDAIALAKRELIEELPSNGVAILNADDERVSAFHAVFSGRVVRYGLDKTADVRGLDVRLRPDGVSFSVDGMRFESALTGRHGVSNLLAGIAVAKEFNIEAGKLLDAVARLQPAKMRGSRELWNGVTILNDCYNSNPDAVHSMIDVLRDENGGRRIAVLGEMLELGSWAVPLHERAGQYAAEANIDIVIGIRGVARDLVNAALRTGLPRERAYFFEEPEEAGAFLREFVRPGDTILFKGSRGTHVERALAIMES